MNSFRNNGIKFNAATLTDTEVLNIMDHTANRRELAEQELGFLTELAVARGLFPNVVILSVEQATQEYGPDTVA